MTIQRPLISIIVAVDEHNGIGRQNQLLCHLPADLAHFKAQTMGKPMIMGMKTYESIGRPLPGRRSIVLSSRHLNIPGISIVHSLAEAIAECADVAEIMIIGGASVYLQSLALTDRIYITKIKHQFEADVYFPALNLDEWIYTSLGTHAKDEKNIYDMDFGRYDRIH